MKQLTWEEYYDGFYDWVPSTQKSYAYRLSDYGSADEVWEIAEELDFEDSAFAAKFLERAFSAGVRFTPEQVLEMVAMVDQSLRCPSEKERRSAVGGGSLRSRSGSRQSSQ